MFKALETTDEFFDQEVQRATIPVLVDFWAPWCGHCKRQSPIIDDLAHEYGNKVRFVKINVEKNKIKANEYNVSGIPLLLLFVNREIKERLTGFQSKQNIRTVLDKYIK